LRELANFVIFSSLFVHCFIPFVARSHPKSNF